ncbi:TraR/DksA family transcriptional regulator [Gryllotalpicola protaetiae]|uniref:Molecular chaperone DnaK n=1 Tax=Gryllotalpicola protaetiae TaxID=2419771 RepID=A0A387BW38_9MICO|nr:TraR/DksA C4-type zinc finger protein [Gryllotalpicola protaetiae]AYG05047.1 molecular chaperone DnaK [Gryllotalpicola protaetiae]
MTEFDDLERMLHARRTELMLRRGELDQAVAGLGALRDANNDDEHDPDGAPVSGEWSRLTGIRHDTESELAATDAALDRISAGTFGVCASCGRPIAPARLTARPTATLCIACAERAGRRP